MPSFANKKQLRFVITLGTSTFDGGQNNQLILQGFRAVVDIDKAGGMMMGTLRAKIYGVSQSAMNSITTLQAKPNGLIANTIEVYAIDGDVETHVYSGNIVNAWGDYQSMPDVFLQIQAQALYYNALKPVPPISVRGTVDVASLMGQIATDMSLKFENNGVNKTITDPYFPKTKLEQAKALAQAADIGFFIDDRILAITPSPYSPRNVDTVPVISAQSGMVGYPTFDGPGINFSSLFNPAITFGGKIQVKTDIPRANGEWIVTSIAHHLESERPNGAWHSTIRCYDIQLAPTR